MVARSVRHGNAVRGLVLLAAVEAVRRPGSGTDRVVARGLVGARRDVDWHVCLLDAGLLDVVRIPVVIVALCSFGSTAASGGVSLEALAPGGAPLLSEGRFEGEIAPLERELGPRNRVAHPLVRPFLEVCGTGKRCTRSGGVTSTCAC